MIYTRPPFSYEISPKLPIGLLVKTPLGYVLRVENNITELFWVEIGEFQFKIKVTKLAPFNSTEASGLV